MGDPQLMLMFYGCSMGILRVSLSKKDGTGAMPTAKTGLQAGLQGLVDAQHVERMRANTSSGRKFQSDGAKQQSKAH